MKKSEKRQVPPAFYQMMVRENIECIEQNKMVMCQLKLRIEAMQAGFPTNHDVNHNITIEQLKGWLEAKPKAIEECIKDMAKFKAENAPNKKVHPDLNKFMKWCYDNVDAFENYEKDYYEEFWPIINECMIATIGEGEDGDTPEMDEIVEQIQQFTGINDRVRFR